MEEEEKIAVFEMLKGMFKPQESTTSSQVLRLEWTKEWAMPELGENLS